MPDDVVIIEGTDAAVLREKRQTKSNKFQR